MEKRPALKLLGITKVYGSGETAVHALKGVDLDFRKNEFVSILGQSGCGKTTLLNIVGGLDRYTDGDLIINGVSTKEYKDSDWDTYRNNKIGFVFQSYNLIPHQNVINNVDMALKLSGVPQEQRRQRAMEVLEKVGLKGMEHKLPNQMSGGQMQRVAIARALVNDPEIILADEPTGALDTETSVQVLDLLKEVAKDRLVIMVTHNPELAKKYSTRIITLLDGNVTGDTNPITDTADEQAVYEEQIGKTEIAVTEDDASEREDTQTLSDCQEIDDGVSDKKTKKKKEKKRKKKSSMSLFTAFRLSLSNLKTKRGRTILTSIAGSIGIIGIALVLALSTGFSGFINKLQADTLSVYPVTVSKAAVDLTDFQKLTDSTVTDELLQQKVENNVYERLMFGDLRNMLKNNKITDEYINYIDNFADGKNQDAQKEGAWAYTIQKGYGMDMNNFIYSDIDLLGVKYTMPIDQIVLLMEKIFGNLMVGTGFTAEFVRQYIPSVCEIPDSQDLVESQYELLAGDWATNEDELLVVVDQYNRIPDITLAMLGIKSIVGLNPVSGEMLFDDQKEFSFDELLGNAEKGIEGRSFYYLTNENRYAQSASGAWYDKTFLRESNPITPDSTLKIKGVVRLKEGISQGVLLTGIAYTHKLVEKVINDSQDSQVVQTAFDNSNKAIPMNCFYLDVNTSTFQINDGDPAIIAMFNSATTIQDKISVAGLSLSHTMTIRNLGGAGKLQAEGVENKVDKISIYSAGYEEKEAIKDHLDAWNDTRTDEADEVMYSDTTDMLFSALNTIVGAVKIVLIAFTSISLVVSSIMIGIITYISVVERTKEIGVLRSIGARKKDISRIFNAETFLIGLFAGIIGIVVTYILTIPINIIVGSFISGGGSIASLQVTHALLLVVVSFALTLVAGIIPARIASKKDPVVALRSE